MDAHGDPWSDAGMRGKASALLRFLVGTAGSRSKVLEGHNDFHFFGHVGLKREGEELVSNSWI